MNLGAWHGFQEVLYKEELHIKEIEFDFSLESGSYLNVILDKRKKGYTGLRFSVNQHLENIYFAISELGEFKKNKPISMPTRQVQFWHHVRLNFEDGMVSFFLDKEELGAFCESFFDQRRLGFRGGLRNALIDNVVIRELPQGTCY